MKLVHLQAEFLAFASGAAKVEEDIAKRRRARHVVSSNCRRCGRACPRVLGTTPEASGFGLRGSENSPQRPGGQTPGVDRQMSWRSRRGRCRQPHAQAGPRSGGSRWRSQRGRARDHRWRVNDRPGADERHSHRPQEPYGAGAGWRHMGRAQSRNATTRSGGHGRGGLEHRGRWAHPRRRTGLADGQVWPRPGQSSLRRAGHRRRQGLASKQG